MIDNTHLTRTAHGAGSLPCASKVPHRRVGEDLAVSLLPAAQDAFARHVKARRAARANPTPGRVAKAEAAWNAVTEAADAIISAPLPRTLDGLRALAVATSMAFEKCLDHDDPVHVALRKLTCGVMMAADEVPPEGHAGL